MRVATDRRDFLIAAGAAIVAGVAAAFEATNSSIQGLLSNGQPDDLLSTVDMSIWLGVSAQWLEIGRTRGYGPTFIRIGPRRVRYRRQDVLEWLAARSYQCTSEYSDHPEQPVAAHDAEAEPKVEL